MSKKENDKPEITQAVIKEILEAPAKRKKGRGIWRFLQIPALAILTGLIIGAIIIAATSENVYAAFGENFLKGIGMIFSEVGTAYWGLLVGSLGNIVTQVQALISGDPASIRSAFNPFLETLVQSTPYIFAGLACAMGFRAGLFNIGVEGQLFMGAAAATYVGYSLTGLPGYIHMPLAFLAGALGGALWGMV
ncbi:MAG TPA: hypothetical protein PK040_06995, partial [Anaerolineaceae bacterium]|nr:hypothetical protein [Anaerolineaceae bacterium]